MAQKTGKPDKPAEQAPADAGRLGGIDKRVVAGVAGIAVGSAAIAAALLFVNRPGKAKQPPAAPPPEPPRGPRAPSAADIDVA